MFSRSVKSSWTKISLPLVIIALVVGFILIPLAPGGRFYYPAVASEEDAFMEFTNGKVYVALFSREGKCVERDSIGTYHREDGGWVTTGSPGTNYPFRCYLFCARFRLPDGRYETLWRRSF